MGLNAATFSAVASGAASRTEKSIASGRISRWPTVKFERRLETVRLGKLILADSVALGQEVDRIFRAHRMRSWWCQDKGLADSHRIGGPIWLSRMMDVGGTPYRAATA